MERQIAYVYKKPDEIVDINNEYRIVSFINGEKDIMKIIRELIKEKY